MVELKFKKFSKNSCHVLKNMIYIISNSFSAGIKIAQILGFFAVITEREEKRKNAN